MYSNNTVTITAVRGNIGSGKSTLLKKLFEEAEAINPGNNILILEPIEQWRPFLEDFNSNPCLETKIALQKEVSNFAQIVCLNIESNPDKNVFIERTVDEHIAIFLDGATEPWTKPLLDFYNRWDYTKYLTKVIDLNVPAETCYERVLKRHQAGDNGKTLEYIQFLEEKYSKLFFPDGLQGPVVFTGNIGAGKSTAIDAFSKKFPNAKVFKERLDIWGKNLARFKKTKSQEDFVTLQCKIASCAKDVYESICREPNSLFLIERSVRENINVFVKPHFEYGYITKSQYDLIVGIWNAWNYDHLIRYICHVDTPVETCYERVLNRNQDGDSGVTLDYLEHLDDIYKSFPEEICTQIGSPVVLENTKLFQKTNIIAFTGNIGAGKSTMIREMAKDLGDKALVLLEPVEEWGEDLRNFKDSNSVEDLIKLQKNIAGFSKKVYKALTSGNLPPYVLIERSNHEHLKIFCEPLLKSGFLTKEQFEEACADYRNFNFDKFITKIIFLDVSPEECYRRITLRRQEGDSSIDSGYIASLGVLYRNLYRGDDAENLPKGSLFVRIKNDFFLPKVQ